MIATENARGDLELKIARALYDILVDHVDGPVDATLCYFLEHLPLREIARLESLALGDPDLAHDYLRRIVGRQSRPRLHLVASHGLR